MDFVLDGQIPKFFHGKWNLLLCTELKVLQRQTGNRRLALHSAAQAHMIAMLHGRAMLTQVMFLDCVPTLLRPEIFSNLGTRLA
jgi:hypothetical protein